MDFNIKLSDIETPAYLYDLKLLKDTINTAKCYARDINIHYAIKANSDEKILEVVKNAGLGCDTVSKGELQTALNAGFNPADIMLAGVGKSDSEIELAITSEIGCINVESIEEIDIIASVAHGLGKTANIALRVNPDIDAHTHHYITTGIAENKFGIDLSLLDEAIDICQRHSNSINLIGLHFHIGSQITITEPFKLLCQRINTLQDKYNSWGIYFENINVGGGLGIDYENPLSNPIPDFKGYFDTLLDNLKLRPGQRLHCELGRAIVGQSGCLLGRVILVKNGINKKFVVIDAGMNCLIRPALYQAYHKIVNLSAGVDSLSNEKYDVVGPICESADCFGEEVLLPTTHRGDILAILSAGAYGETMSSYYNCRKLAPNIYSE